MAENRLKIHICRILRSCKSRHQISDVIPRRRRRRLVDLFSPQSPFTYSHAAHEDEEEEETKLPFLSPDVSGRKCPPASPLISPLKNYQHQKKKKISGNNKTGRSFFINRKCAGFQDMFPDCKYVNGLLISDDDKEEEEVKARLSCSRRRMEAEAAVAVVKRSSDPYNDFRTSMVEMIVEKNIFSAKDLENLLRCFLSLNSCHHHKVIIEVFAEIWEAFSCNAI